MLFLRDIDVDVMMRCRACGHEGTLPRADLERRFGPGYPVLSLAPHFRCSKCNSRDVESRPLPTPDGPVLETMVDKAATAEVEDRFHSTLAALRGLVDAAHDTGDAGEDHRTPHRPAPKAPEPPPPPDPESPPLGSMMAALRGLTAGLEDEDGDGHGDEGAPVIPPSREPHALQPPFAPMEPPPPQDEDEPDDFLKELQRISRLMGDDGPPPAPPSPPASPPPAAAVAPTAAEGDDEDWLPALFRDALPPGPQGDTAPVADAGADDDDDAFALTDPAMDDGAAGPADARMADMDDEPVADAPRPAHLTDTLAALRSMIQSAAKDEGPDGEHDRPVPPPARPDFGYHRDDRGEDDGDEALDLSEPAFGVPPRAPDPATDQDLSALKAMVEKAERDADRSISAADIASVIPPDFRPPFWVEAGLDRAPAPSAPPAAAPPPVVAAPPVQTPEPPDEPPRRKGSFLSRLRRRRADSHHDAPPEPPPPAPVPDTPAKAAAPAFAAPPPPPDDPEPSDETLDQRLAALKALLAGDEAAPAPPPPPVPKGKAGWDDDDILDLEAFAEEEPSPAAEPVDDDFRRILFNRLQEEKEHPHHPAEPASGSVPDGGPVAHEDIPMEDILSFTNRGRGHEPPDKPSFHREDDGPPEDAEPEEEAAPADFGRFAIRDPDILFARSHDGEDEDEPPSYLWDDPEPFDITNENAMSAHAVPEEEVPPLPPAPMTKSEPLPPVAASARPDAESYARTLAALRGILGAQGADGGDNGSSERGGDVGGGRRRRKKSI